MIRYLRQYLACRRLNKLVARRLASFEVQDFARRRNAMLKVTRPQKAS
jgi:hypothetical protein